jgi:CheY-like chemotaxis protein/anti-sigma regulatory factor (Ser/Thr protein kinase)
VAGGELVLVVDDSAIDRRLAGRLVEKRGFVARYAADGRDALRQIGEERPSIVVTDLRMPELNGLELVEAVRKSWPSIPVVLMTAHGSEEIAMLALRTGAASYVPKRRLADDLANTLEAILELCAGAQDRVSSVDPADAQQTAFVIENDVDALPAVVGQLEADLARLAFCDETEILQIGVALREAIVNAIYHGNLEVSSSLLDDGGTGFADLAAARRATEPYASRKVRVAASYQPDEVVYRIADEGPGFDPSSLPDPTDVANLERVHGRGLMLMRMFMDDVSHDPKGNVVTMKKTRRAAR